MKNYKWLLSATLTAVLFTVVFLGCKKTASLPPVVNGGAAGINVFGAKALDNINQPQLPAPVVTTVVTGSSVTVSWVAVPNAVGYHVVVEGGGGSIADTTATSVTFANLSSGAYSVKVLARATTGKNSQNNNSDFSTKVPFTIVSTVVKTKLAAPVVHAAIISYNSGKGNATVTWDNVANATGYTMTLNGNPVTPATSPMSLTSLAPGNYTVAVTAVAGITTNYLNSDAGTAVFTVNVTKPIATPAISGTVSYSAPSAGSVSVSPLFIWPPNNKLTTVTFVGSGIISSGTGTINATYTTVNNATSYVMTPSVLSNLAPGAYTVSVTAIAGGTYTDDNWVDSLPGTMTFNVLPGSLSFNLVDEYGVYTHSYTLSSNFTLSLQLMASRLGTDMDGRDYTFTVTATNGGNQSVSTSTVSNVPHDQR
jgi:hypothetical protein